MVRGLKELTAMMEQTSWDCFTVVVDWSLLSLVVAFAAHFVAGVAPQIKACGFLDFKIIEIDRVLM